MLLAGKYKLGERIGKGAFGQIYDCVDVNTGRKLAIKQQPDSNEYEYRVLLSLRETGVVPKTMMYFESDDDAEEKASYLCMQKMSMDLRGLSKCRKIDRRLLLALSVKLFGALKKIHDRGWIHRDIKPGNIMFGDDDVVVYLIDFGLAKKYCSDGGMHIPFMKNKSTVVGTAKYLSRWCHEHVQQSRRDDCASLMYTVVQVGKGKLPWGREASKDPKEKMRRIFTMKRTTTPEELCEGMPRSFRRIMRCVDSLGFEQRPEYSKYQRYLLEDWARL